MRLAIKLAFLAAVATTASTAVLAADPTGSPFKATLDGANEVTVQGGDPDGFGSATVRINPGRGELCYSITVSGIAPATAAHIHEAAAGTNGRVIITLSAPTTGSSSGCVPILRELALEIKQAPEDYYVNVHNAEFPAGAVRGQLGL